MNRLTGLEVTDIFHTCLICIVFMSASLVTSAAPEGFAVQVNVEPTNRPELRNKRALPYEAIGPRSSRTPVRANSHAALCLYR
jgi:hypothetical protein